MNRYKKAQTAKNQENAFGAFFWLFLLNVVSTSSGILVPARARAILLFRAAQHCQRSFGTQVSTRDDDRIQQCHGRYIRACERRTARGRNEGVITV